MNRSTVAVEGTFQGAPCTNYLISKGWGYAPTDGSVIDIIGNLEDTVEQLEAAICRVESMLQAFDLRLERLEEAADFERLSKEEY